MPDPLYAIDTTDLSLVELAAAVPNLLIYTLRQQPTNAGGLEVMQNFTVQELAVLAVRARAASLSGYSLTSTVAVSINGGTAFASLTIPAVSASGTSFSPLWSADPGSPTLLGATDYLEATNTGSWSGAPAAVDVLLIPSSQLPLLGS